jgi:uncharacterized protein
LNKAERTICNSDELSGYDRSVSNAYKYAIRILSEIGDINMVTALRLSQNTWITERNLCHIDKVCIKASMIKRIDEILGKSKW